MMLGTGSNVAAVLAAALLVLFGISTCAAQAEAGKPSSSPRPIRVQTDEVEPITFSRLLVRPNDEFDISVAPDDFAIAILDELRRHGHNVVGAENILFGVDKSSKARMILGGTITEFGCRRQPKTNRMTCDIAISWELFDRRVDEVVYKVLTRGRKYTVKRQQVESKTVHQLVLLALDSLLSRQQLVALLTKSEAVGGSFDDDPGEYRACNDGRRELPAQLGEVLGATVIVKVGDTIGSGFFFSPDGLLITAHHVVDGVNSALIRNQSGKLMEATVVRRDKPRDVAVLRVEGEVGMPCLPLAATAPRTGDELYAIGAPAGEDLAFSVSRGIVSGLREVEGQQFVQTDASINPGNSGGPLVNLVGEVVAVVSWKVMHAGFEGLGFGVPAAAELERMGFQEGEVTTAIAASVVGGEGDPDYPILGIDDPRPGKTRQVSSADDGTIQRRMQQLSRAKGLGITFLVLGGIAGAGGAACFAAGLEFGGIAAVTVGGGLIVVGAIVAGAAAHRQRKLKQAHLGPPRLAIAPLLDQHGAALSLDWTF